MTRMAAPHESRPVEAGARTPADEIEITPEMTAAGWAAMAAHDRDFESAEEGAERIFRAMWAARTLPGSRAA
jgi:hypothetical protein